jgi:uncharacterized protein YjbI with pentapeptide repeats
MKKISEPSFSEECISSTIKKESTDQRIDNRSFMDEDCKQNLSMLAYYECTFERINFHGKMEKMEFVDVIFDHCDLSNVDMQECVFRRVIMKHCRLTGCDMSASQLHDMAMENCQANYINCNLINSQSALFKDCIFIEGAFTMMKIKDLAIEKCDFTSSEWNDTKLNGLDFSDSIIDGIAVNPNNLRGVIVSQAQAAVMAKLLGIQVK